MVQTITDSQQIKDHIAKVIRRAKVIDSNEMLKQVLTRFPTDEIRKSVFESIKPKLKYESPEYPFTDEAEVRIKTKKTKSKDKDKV